MKTLIFLLAFLLFRFYICAQTSCEVLSNPVMPPTPYEIGYLKFDGKGDFLRTSDLNALEFDNSTTDNFMILAKIKVTKPFADQRIFGKYYSAGWMLGYHTSHYGYVSIYFSGAGWKHVYYLGADTSWHSYKISYNKQSQSLKTYVDDSLIYQYSNFVFNNLQNVGAFSAGNVGFLPLSGNQSVNLYTSWFNGYMDDLRIDVNQIPVVNYNFNEGAGQVIRDSTSYFITDRTNPSETNCGSTHLMVGFNPSQDTCDPQWIREEENLTTKFRSLGAGLQYWHSGEDGEYFAEHFSLGLTVWNGYLINGGKFNRAGGTVANHISKWDGNSWSPIGLGLNHEVLYLTTYQNELYATGYFDTAYGVGETRHIAKWNGNSWKPLDYGLSNLGTVMIVYNGELIVGGYFMSAGQIYSPGIARWNGSEWSTMGGGMLGSVWALCEYNGDLYAGGNFYYAGTEVCNGISKWNGSSWQPVGIGVSGGDNIVFVLKVYNGSLYAGGGFINMNQTLCYNIARYDGITWYPVGSGAQGSRCIPSDGHVIDMEVYNNELFVIGQFTNVNGIPANKIAKWNGTNWCGIEYGMDLRPEDLEIYQGDLIINGDFHSISGNEFNNIAKYNPNIGITGGINKHTVATNYSLYQNYPNPFNPVTKINYDLPKNSKVDMVIYDILGREVKRLVNNEFKSAGSYVVEFSGQNYASGVYFYHIEAEDLDGEKFVDSKKMVLVK